MNICELYLDLGFGDFSQGLSLFQFLKRQDQPLKETLQTCTASRKQPYHRDFVEIKEMIAEATGVLR